MVPVSSMSCGLRRSGTKATSMPGTVGVRPGMLFVFVLVALLVPCEALYEDQVGQWDWHQQYLGRVTHAAFSTRSTGVRRVFVATEEHAVASLNLRTGEILWRKVLGVNDHIDALEYAHKKCIISLSGGSSVRAWNENDGGLLWEAIVPFSNIPPILLVPDVDINNHKVQVIFVASGSSISAISVLDGRTVWKADFPSFGGDVNIRLLQLSNDKTGVIAAGFVGTSELAVAVVDLLTGKVIHTKRFHFSGILSTEAVVLNNDVVVAINSEGSTILTASLAGDQHEKLTQTAVGSLFASTSSHAVLLPLRIEGAFALRIKSKILILKHGADEKFHAVQTIRQPGGISESLRFIDHKHAVAIFQSESVNSTHQDFSFRVVEASEFKDELAKDALSLPCHRGSMRLIFLNSYTRVDRSHGFRALVVGEDSSLSLLQQGEVVWVREDGLGAILDTKTADLPPELEGVSVSEVEHGLVEWLKGHWLKLKATLMFATPEDREALKALQLHSADKTKMTRDHNGFRKLLIVLTKAGKLLALHSGDGHIVWSILLPAFRSHDDGSYAIPVTFVPWQIPHQHALDENPVVLVLAKLGPSTDAPGVLSWVDVRLGVELRHLRLSYPVKQIIPLPVTDRSEQRLHLLIDNHLKAHLLPSSQESLDLFQNRVHDTYHYVVDQEKGAITGFSVRKGVRSVLDTSEAPVFDSEKLWTVVFPSETETISTVVSRKLDEIVHTQTKVLSDRDVLYKYLNKNTVFVTTVAPHSPGSLGAVTPDKNWVVAYLIDTVTGRIIHRVTYHHLIGPVHAVFRENWIVFNAFNLRTSRYEMSVLEVYEKSRLGDMGLLPLILGRHNVSSAVSSFSNPGLEVKSQSYFFTYTVKAMTVTDTARGITSKQVLVGTVTDQVLALDKRLLDPRRTLNPTAAEKEEGIIPHTDVLPIFPQAYLTHVHQVEGLRGIVTFPAGLESTSLVFAYGLDVFYTRTAPSKTYDSLTEEFSYALLLITIVALLVGIAVTWIWSERKDLTEKWK